MKPISEDKKTVLNELYKLKSGRNYVRRIYFLWKNKVKTGGDIDYSAYTKEEFIDKFCDGNIHVFKNLEKWENTKQYQRLLLIFMNENFILDLQKTYDKVREKALEGDEKSIKLMLMLQKELKELLKAFDSVDIQSTKQEQEGEEDEDDLIIE